MINLHTRTEYTFRYVYGPLGKVIDAVGPAPALSIVDRNGTWGHVAFDKAIRKAGKHPIFGVELACVPDSNLKERQHTNWMSFLARNNAGLQQIYELVTQATDHFYYTPRIDYRILSDVGQDIIILSGSNPLWDSLSKKKKNLFVELGPNAGPASAQYARQHKLCMVAASDNFYPRPEHRQIYEVITGRNRDNRTTLMYILDEWEWRLALEKPWLRESDLDGGVAVADKIAAECQASIPKAIMVKFKSPKTLRQLCEEAAPGRKINLKDKVYRARLDRELALIAEKEFEDYFFVIHDMIRYAKTVMLVGPARGSSCGSLVCYLLGITEIDPIPYDLLFERFIDVNRKDLPDVDIDFQDDRRDMVFQYIQNKYGADCVARLGTINRYKAKSAIGDVARELSIPQYEVTDLKGAIIERSGGDSRAAFCILDTFNELEIGREFLRKYPQLRIAADIENHAKHSGQHAAGIVITAHPVSCYCSIDQRTGAAMVDKYDAEGLNLLKIDALGLRTLTIIQDVLDQVGWEREQLLRYPVDDPAAFQLINDRKYAGIFQFEGFALQSLCRQMTVENFEDIASLTALARPGPLESGGASEYIKRRTGKEPVKYLDQHGITKPITKVTFGIVIYQEQVMQIARAMGNLSWEDVSSLRKAMSKSLGKEFFDGYKMRFLAGAASQGIGEEEATKVWENINTMGSWSFNRSHAVAYGTVSYWCSVLKAHYPVEYTAAYLRHTPDQSDGVKMLREFVRNGNTYVAFDSQRSQENWSTQDGILIGGLTGIAGIGPSKARDIIERRKAGRPLTPGLLKKLTNPKTAWDHVFECEQRFGHIQKDPAKYNIKSPIIEIASIDDDYEGDVLFFGKLMIKNLRDLNELGFVQRRGGRRVHGQTLFLNLTVEDDTGSIICTIDKRYYSLIGIPIVESGKIGDWYLWKGQVQTIKRGFRKVFITRHRKLD